MLTREQVAESLFFLAQHIGAQIDDGDTAYGLVHINLRYKPAIEEAARLLKPRLMELDEVEQYAKEGRPFYLEYVNGTFGWTVPENYSRSSFEHGIAETPALRQFFSYYNKVVAGEECMAFRCWTDVPTAEQMEEAKWNHDPG